MLQRLARMDVDDLTSLAVCDCWTRNEATVNICMFITSMKLTDSDTYCIQ